MKSYLALLSLILALSTLCRAQEETVEEAPLDFETLGGEEGPSGLPFITLTVVNESFVILPNVSYRNYATRISGDRLIHIVDYLPDTLEYVITDSSGTLITNQSIFTSGVESEYFSDTLVDDIQLNNQNWLIVSGNTSGIYGNIIDPQGTAVGSQYLITETSERSALPLLYKFADGNILVLLLEYTQNSTLQFNTTDYHYLSAVILDPEGVPTVPKFNITEELVIDARSLEDTNSNELPVIWILANNTMFGRTVDSSGVMGDPRLLTTVPAVSINGFFAVPNTSNAIVGWESPLDESGTQFGVYNLVFNNQSLEVVRNAYRVEPILLASQYTSKMMELPNTNYFYTWYYATGDISDWAAKGLVLDSENNVVVPEFNISSPQVTPTLYLFDSEKDVSIYQDRYIFVTWTANCSDANNQIGNTQIVAFLDFEGNIILEEDLMGNCSAPRGLASGYLFPNDSITVIWRDPLEGTMANSTLYGRIIRVEDSSQPSQFGEETAEGAEGGEMFFI